MEMKKFAQGHMAGGKEGRETSRCHSKPVLNLHLLSLGPGKLPVHCGFRCHIGLTPKPTPQFD